MAKTHMIETRDGTNIHVREWGVPDGPPVLFIHGWSQSHLAWKHQYESELATELRLVAMDLRGHGMSDAPLNADYYTDGQRWADDVAAVIEQLNLRAPVLVGWSYGGLVAGDYLRVHGQTGIAGVNYVGGTVTLKESAFGTLIGPGFLDHVEGATQPDLPTNIQTMREFLRGSTAKPIARDDFETVLAFNIIVPPEVRAGMIAREIDSDDVLKSLAVPVLVTHGRDDQLILPAMGEHVLEVCPTATASWYEGTGHLPFLENPERFNRELASFVRRCAAPDAVASG